MENKKIKKTFAETKEFCEKWEKELTNVSLSKFLPKGFEFKAKNKGWLGNLIQTEIFKIPANSRSEPDFNDYGVELKVSGLKESKKDSLQAKERLVFSCINYEKIISQPDIYNSDFLNKNRYILLVFYKYDSNFVNKNYRNIKLISTVTIDLTKLEEFDQIERDYKTIFKLVAEGKAHEISSSTTEYLEACTKGSNGQQLRKQPNSEIKAKSRAWAFKNKLLTSIFYNTLKKVNFKNYKNIEEISNEILKYKNFTKKQLSSLLNLEITKIKHDNSLIVKNILKIKRFDEIKVLAANQIAVKTITLKKDSNNPTEHSPIVDIDINDFNNEQNFYESELYNVCSSGIFYVVFKEDSTEEKELATIYDCCFITFTKNELEEIKHVYYKTMDLCNNGVVYVPGYETAKRRPTNYIHESDNLAIHVRPKAQNKNQTYITKNNQVITKICFSLNRKTFSKKYNEYLLKKY